MSKIQFTVKGAKATAKEMEAITKLRLERNFVRVINKDSIRWSGWQDMTLDDVAPKPKRTRKPRAEGLKVGKPAVEPDDDLIGQIDDN